MGALVLVLNLNPSPNLNRFWFGSVVVWSLVDWAGVRTPVLVVCSGVLGAWSGVLADWPGFTDSRISESGFSDSPIGESEGREGPCQIEPPLQLDPPSTVTARSYAKPPSPCTYIALHR